MIKKSLIAGLIVVLVSLAFLAVDTFLNPTRETDVEDDSDTVTVSASNNGGTPQYVYCNSCGEVLNSAFPESIRMHVEGIRKKVNYVLLSRCQWGKQSEKILD